jgi:GT2 family glycosyltransferase
MQKNMITVVICTFRRNRLLRKCLNALNTQTASRSEFSILVVDNYGSEECKVICKEFKAGYVHEANIGLSAARNRALKEIDDGWIFYIDDDGVPREDLMAQFILATQDEDIKIIGGKYCHYFEKAPPKWLMSYYKKCHEPIATESLTQLPKRVYLSGGIMAIRKPLVLQAGSFNTSLGMKNKNFGYGEEDQLQDRIRALGIPVYFSPKLVMDHLVSPRKYTIRSRIKMAYAHGAATTSLTGHSNYSFLDFGLDFLRITFITIPYDIARCFLRRNFYWQNSVVSTGTKYAFSWGKLTSNNWPASRNHR